MIENNTGSNINKTGSGGPSTSTRPSRHALKRKITSLGIVGSGQARSCCCMLEVEQEAIIQRTKMYRKKSEVLT